MFRRTPYLLLALFLYSCAGKKDGANTSAAFFDISGFMNEQASLLEFLQPAIRKTVIANGITETLKLHTTDWHREFAPFRECDISNPLWKESYAIDTVAGAQDEAYTITYTAKDSSFPVRNVKIYYGSNEKISRFHIEQRIKNGFCFSSRELDYIPLRGYLLTSSRHIAIAGESRYEIRAELE